MQFYFAQGDQQKGPVDAGQLGAAGVRPDTLVWREGMAEWQEAGRVPELAGLLAGGAPSPSPFPSPTSSPVSAPSPAPYEPSASQRPAYSPQTPGSHPYVPAGGYPSPGYGQPGQHGVAPQLSYGGYAGPLQSPPPPQGLSVASMVLGIIAIPSTFCYGTGIPLAILAVVFGHLGHAQYKRATGQSSGMAIAGLICGYLSLALVAVLFIFVFVVVGAAAAANSGR